MLNKILCVTLLGLIGGLAPLTAQTPAAAAAAPAKVKGKIIAARIQGHVEVKTKGGTDSRLLKQGETIYDGTEVTTSSGAIAILVFSNGATVNVAEGSTLDVDEFIQDPFAGDLNVGAMKHEEGISTTKLSLARGELVGKVVHLNVDQGSEFTVQTPVGAAGIRGTTFQVVYVPQADGTVLFQVTTLEGTVLYSTNLGTVPVPAGKTVAATFTYTAPAAGAAPTAPSVLVAPAVTDTTPDVTANLVALAQTIVDVNSTAIITAITPAAAVVVPPPTNGRHRFADPASDSALHLIGNLLSLGPSAE